MNLLYLHCHDAGRYLSPYGYPVPTPHLQALAQESTVFRQCYCAAPTCSPSRVALLTGVTPHQAGMLGLAHRGFRMRDPSWHLARFLKERGYRTVLSGLQHEVSWQRVESDLGYEVLRAEGDLTHAQRDHAQAQLMVEFLKSKPAGPFFASFGAILPHREFPEFDGSIDERYVMPPSCLPDTAETRRDWARYGQAAREMDGAMGTVLTALRESGLEKETVILFTTDHGVAFPWMKCTLLDSGIGVAAMLKFPGNPAAGAVEDGLVSHVDFFPTFCELLGVGIPAGLQGRSLVPMLRGETDSVRDAIFAEVSYHAAYEPMRCVRTRRFKYIRQFHETPHVVLPNIDDGETKSLLMGHGLGDSWHENEVLFDVILDPSERRNLAADPEHRTALAEMRQRLERWMDETDDPLRRGSVPLPAEARVNAREGASPSEPAT